MRYHSLDFWRGIACLLVIVFHSTFYAQDRGGGLLGSIAQHLWAGVPMFFVISGYCIAAAADSSARHRRSPLEYFRRRFWRIYPPYWIFFAIAAVFVTGIDKIIPGMLFSSGAHPFLRANWLDGWQLLGNLTLTESWRHHVIGSARTYFLDHAWTLCYEEQFYAVMGLALAFAPRRLFMASDAVTLATLGTMATGNNLRGFFFDGHWLEFAAGIAVYRAINYRAAVPAAAILAIAWLVQGATAGDWIAASRAVAFAFGLLLILIHRHDAILHASSPAYPIRWCGVMCYSLYLVHWPVCKLITELTWRAGAQSDVAIAAVTLPLCILASIAAGWLFHVHVERRFLNSPTA